MSDTRAAEAAKIFAEAVMGTILFFLILFIISFIIENILFCCFELYYKPINKCGGGIKINDTLV